MIAPLRCPLIAPLLHCNVHAVEDRDGDGATALHYAAGYGFSMIAEELLNAKAEVMPRSFQR